MSWLSRLLPSPPVRGDAAVSRREFVSGGFLRAFAVAVAAPPAPSGSPPDAGRRHAAAPLLRPPGALPEPAFLAACTRCADCVRACPHQAIVLAPDRMRAAAGSPMIDPVQQPCLMCVDTPCITSCTPHALRRDPETPVPAIGTARISTVDCLAHQGTTCSSCIERCPVEGAIQLTGGRPQVSAERCTGCGICHHVCPAPRNAVLVMPRRSA